MKIIVVKEAYAKQNLSKVLKTIEKTTFINCNTLEEALCEADAYKEESTIIFIKEIEGAEFCVNHKKLKIQTFGNFEVFYQGSPVAFRRTKSKELLAYLIDRRGATVTTAEACGILWEDREYNFSLQRQFQTVVSELRKSLRRHKAEHIIRKGRNCLSVDVSGLDCDLYRLMEGDLKVQSSYNGEYMSNYSWAEMTAGFLNQKYGNASNTDK